jgi:hypothetical protein
MKFHLQDSQKTMGKTSIRIFEGLPKETQHVFKL